jgi:spermidine dehydrogenase
MHRRITRRDFLNGSAIALGSFAAGAQLLAYEDYSNPPALTGMRGDHDGCFDAMHALRDKRSAAIFGTPEETDEKFDLVVVGGGISGLAAAYFYRAAAGPQARILILDNHDDFGGHAKRNEFRVSGRLLLANGGTYAIESPTSYSRVAHGLMNELGVAPTALESKCDRNGAVYSQLGSSVFFNKETFGTDKLVTALPERDPEVAKRPGREEWQKFLDRTPLSQLAREQIAKLEADTTDYLPGLSQTEKKRHLAKTSYRDFLVKITGAGSEVIAFYQTRTHDLYGVGIDAVSALDSWAYGFAGFRGMKLDRVPSPELGFTASGEITKREPYFFHFPDGNASIARLLVRSLVSHAITGSTADDIVLAKTEYSALDRTSSPVRIRLNSTAVLVKHVGPASTGGSVEVQYVTKKKLFRVHAKSVVMACWNMAIPYICPELPEEQKTALAYGAKVPIVYTVVALWNWRPFFDLKIRRIESPGMYHSSAFLDDAVDIGGYKSPRTPDQPILLRMLRTPCKPGLSERDQHRIGRYDLLSTTFETFERNIRDQLTRTLGPAGFDAARDIQAITVNRWAHGYAYEYNSLFDPDWPAGQRPCDIGRRRFGRITIANSDAAAAAYTDQAIDQAYRAITELLNV